MPFLKRIFFFHKKVVYMKANISEYGEKYYGNNSYVI